MLKYNTLVEVSFSNSQHNPNLRWNRKAAIAVLYPAKLYPFSGLQMCYCREMEAYPLPRCKAIEAPIGLLRCSRGVVAPPLDGYSGSKVWIWHNCGIQVPLPAPFPGRPSACPLSALHQLSSCPRMPPPTSSFPYLSQTLCWPGKSCAGLSFCWPAEVWANRRRLVHLHMLLMALLRHFRTGTRDLRQPFQGVF